MILEMVFLAICAFWAGFFVGVAWTVKVAREGIREALTREE